MGDKVRRFTVAVLFCLVLCCSLYAGTVGYVYGNNVSSADMAGVPRGQVYTDADGNILITRKTAGDIVMFDRLVSKTAVQKGSELTQRGPFFTVTAWGGLNHALASVSMTTVLYPFSPIVMAGVTYGKEAGTMALVLAGAEVAVPLARLWDSAMTLVRNGKFTGSGAVGVGIGSATKFASFYSFGYRHNIGTFCWEAGFSWLRVSDTISLWTPYAGVGVCF